MAVDLAGHSEIREPSGAGQCHRNRRVDRPVRTVQRHPGALQAPVRYAQRHGRLLHDTIRRQRPPQPPDHVLGRDEHPGPTVFPGHETAYARRLRDIRRETRAEADIAIRRAATPVETRGQAAHVRPGVAGRRRRRLRRRGQGVDGALAVRGRVRGDQRTPEVDRRSAISHLHRYRDYLATCRRFTRRNLRGARYVDI